MTEPSPVERLYAVLAAAGITLTAAELAEVLWLAARVAPAAVAPGPAAAAPPARPGPPAPPGPDGAVHGDILPPPPGADVYAAAGPAVDGAAALPVLLRADRALPAQRRLTRALRPLRRPVPSSRERELDENATADLVADTGVLDLALRPRRERWLDVALVVDDGLSMQVWRELSRELGALLQSAGIFRRVRSYGLDTRHPDGPYLSHRPFAAPGTPLPPARCAPPTAAVWSWCSRTRWAPAGGKAGSNRCWRPGPVPAPPPSCSHCPRGCGPAPACGPRPSC